MPKQEEKLSVWIRLAYGSGDFYGGAIAAPIAFLACGFYFGWKFPITPGRFARIQKWLELKRQNSLHQLEPGVGRAGRGGGRSRRK